MPNPRCFWPKFEANDEEPRSICGRVARVEHNGACQGHAELVAAHASTVGETYCRLIEKTTTNPFIKNELEVFRNMAAKTCLLKMKAAAAVEVIAAAEELANGVGAVALNDEAEAEEAAAVNEEEAAAVNEEEAAA